VVVQHGARDRAERGNLLDQAVADPRVQLDQRALLGSERGGLQKDSFADPDLADVVQE
jgi:hypothetical protein